MNITVYIPPRLADKYKKNKHKLKISPSKLFQKAFRDFLTDGGDSQFHFERSQKLNEKMARIKEIIEEE
jgi:DNA-binding transcriptional MocR family regulator